MPDDFTLYDKTIIEEQLMVEPAIHTSKPFKILAREGTSNSVGSWDYDNSYEYKAIFSFGEKTYAIEFHKDSYGDWQFYWKTLREVTKIVKTIEVYE